MTIKVKRFYSSDNHFGGPTMEENPNGGYVSYEDYIALAKNFASKKLAYLRMMDEAISWKDKYYREVEGLNNEGDPIGGEPAMGLRQQVERLQAEREKCIDIIRNYQGSYSGLPKALNMNLPHIVGYVLNDKEGSIKGLRALLALVQARKKEVILPHHSFSSASFCESMFACCDAEIAFAWWGCWDTAYQTLIDEIKRINEF